MVSAEDILTNPPALNQSSTRLVRSHLRGDLADAVWAPAEQQACGENEVQPGMVHDVANFFHRFLKGPFYFLEVKRFFFGTHSYRLCDTLYTCIFRGFLKWGMV